MIINNKQRPRKKMKMIHIQKQRSATTKEKEIIHINGIIAA